jgi:hypothetical protein
VASIVQTVASGEDSLDAVKEYLDELRPYSGFKICPGLKHYPEELLFDTNNLRQWGLPFNRIDAKSCALWHIPHNIHHPAGSDLRDTCQPCRLLHRDITKLIEIAAPVSSAQKLSRKSVHSNYPLKYLSPTSKVERVSKLSKERKQPSCPLSQISNTT